MARPPFPPHLLTMIRDRIAAGDFETGSHVMARVVAGSFTVADVIRAIRSGIIIENYPDRQRCLICAQVRLGSGQLIWLHVVCEYAGRVTVGLTTAYIPNPREWDDPPLRRR